ncbi:hypothetical protein FLX27_22125 [Agrobacterium tumefaciens]|nr:hypothetical protein [Agrobacterium tumefaciens]TQN59610.1 hypothetical protein FLX27_22125 [Agrobacterium tumefaciens]
MKTWSEEGFAGYLAAMIDGEGHIEIIASCSVRIRIANTVKHTLDAMALRLGFGRVIEYARPKDKNYKRLFCLEVSNARDIKAMFGICGGFIHMKIDQMDAAVAIIDRVLSEGDRIDERNKAILAAVKAGDRKQNEIARAFGVSPQLVSHIKLGHTWTKVISGHRARALDKKFPRESSQAFRLHGEPTC